MSCIDSYANDFEITMDRLKETAPSYLSPSNFMSHPYPPITFE